MEQRTQSLKGDRIPEVWRNVAEVESKKRRIFRIDGQRDNGDGQSM